MNVLFDIWQAGVAAVGGARCVQNWLEENPQCRPTRVAAIGKAAPEMAKGAVQALGQPIPTLIIGKRGQTDAARSIPGAIVMESAHPIPDESSLVAGQALLDFIALSPGDADVLVLVSGGASSLVEVLKNGHTLADLGRINEQMLSQALDIVQINQSRRHFSSIKGGALLANLSARSACVLAVSDVPGDDIEVIGSGIGAIGQCPVPGSQAYIVASNSVARSAAARHCIGLGLRPVIEEECLHGTLDEVADHVAALMIDGPPGAYIFGGEPYLDLPPNPGQGGRNQALALEVARRIDGHAEIHFLAAGSDGGDGPGNAAGGYVNGNSWRSTSGGDLAARHADAGTWLKRGQGILVTGPTGTNVMDLAIGYKDGAK